MNTIGERLKQLRKDRNITMKELADTTKISKGNLSSYENNKFKPSADALILIADFFNVSIDWLLKGTSNLNYSNIIKTPLPTIKEMIQEYSTTSNTPEFTEDELNIITLYRQLSERDQIKIEGIMETKILENPKKKRTKSSSSQNGEDLESKNKMHA